MGEITSCEAATLKANLVYGSPRISNQIRSDVMISDHVGSNTISVMSDQIRSDPISLILDPTGSNHWIKSDLIPITDIESNQFHSNITNVGSSQMGSGIDDIGVELIGFDIGDWDQI